jgi:hypothetical protein
MPRSHRDITAARRVRLTRSSMADRAVFENAYDLAMQVIVLREMRSLTQAQLACPGLTRATSAGSSAAPQTQLRAPCSASLTPSMPTYGWFFVRRHRRSTRSSTARRSDRRAG